MRNYSLTQLPINQVYVSELVGVGVKTIKDVLAVESSPVSSVPQEWFDAIRSLATILTVSGVGPKLAGQLYWAGIRTVSDLAECDAGVVVKAIRERDPESRSLTKLRHFRYIQAAKTEARVMVDKA